MALFQIGSAIIWQDGLRIYRKALNKARAAYYSILVEDNRNNPRFLSRSVARLTPESELLQPCVPVSLSSIDFMIFFNSIIVLIRWNLSAFGPQMAKIYL